MCNIGILGIGNILLKDDGIGVHIINELLKEDYPQNVDIVDGGTSILDLLDVFVKNDKIIVVDTLKGGHEPGTIYKVTPEEMGSYIKSNSSLHDVQVLDMLKNANLLGYNPKVIIIGVEPSEIEYDIGLSNVLKSEFTNLLNIVRQEIELSLENR
ncbi:hydrogenase maturation protease [Romboutsia sp.]|uniref:hydrogenase maturation protease n=1 Tax=Romboutsia sp. TaxID=1965302 RepID=UPI002BC141D8|nr:hydrogenase maturation protease [Romboutsia sp.]HSQ87795.1 hydrogenase maturation protease [Romboutsia sp.]